MTHPTLTIPPARIFINYAHEDVELAKKLVADLNRIGADVWFDANNIKGGDLWRNEMDKGIRRSQFLLALMTKHSFATEKQWVQYEQLEADRLLKVLIPCIFYGSRDFFKDHELEAHLNPTSAIFFDDWENGLLKLVESIQNRLSRHGDTFANQAEGLQTKFVGRQQDLQNLRDLIYGDAHSSTAKIPVVITASGGMGKTMLAQELVRRIGFHFFGGTITIDRGSNQTRAKIIVSNWARKLRPPLERDYAEDELSELINDVRSGLHDFGELLVLIDDVIERDREEVGKLMDALPPDANVLLTTRLDNYAGGLTYKLEPMSREDGIALLKSRLHDRLFTSVNTEQEHQFEQSIKANEDQLGDLYELVEGHPLALDLGIGNCSSIASIPSVIRRLQNSFARGIADFKDRTALHASSKNKSLAASLRISLLELEEYDAALHTDLVRLFSCLGVFPDGSVLSKTLIGAVWKIKDKLKIADYLQIMVSRALLRVNVFSGEYFNHPVIRAFATGLLETRDDRENIWNGYFEWILRMTRIFFMRPNTVKKDFDILIVHVEHIGKRLRERLEASGIDLYAMGQPEAREISVHVQVKDALLNISRSYALVLKDYVLQNPEWGQQGLRLLLIGLVIARIKANPEEEVIFLKDIGRAKSRYDLEVAGQYFSKALELSQKHELHAETNSILSYYGELERTKGNFEDSLKLLESALALHQELHDEKLQAETLTSIGEIYWRMSNFKTAFEKYEKAGRIYEDIHLESGKADLLNKVGSVYFNMGKHEKAIELFKEAEEMHLRLGNESMRAEDINDMGAAYRYLKKRPEALECFNKAIEIHVNLSNKRLESLTRSNRAGVLCDMQQFKPGLKEAHRAVKLALEVDDTIAHIWSYCWLGTAYAGLYQVMEADLAFNQSIKAARRTLNPRGLAGVLGMYAYFLHRQVDSEKAKAPIEEAYAIMQKHELKQVFGSRTFEDMQQLKNDISQGD